MLVACRARPPARLPARRPLIRPQLEQERLRAQPAAAGAEARTLAQELARLQAELEEARAAALVPKTPSMLQCVLAAWQRARPRQSRSLTTITPQPPALLIPPDRYQALQRAVADMEARHEQRARELEAVASTSRQQAEVARLRDARQHALAIREKDRQIVQFKAELDALLQPLTQIVAAQSQAQSP